MSENDFDMVAYTMGRAAGGGGSGGVTDVQINGTSVVSSGVANIPLADGTNLGVAKVGSGLYMASEGDLKVSKSNAAQVKAGANEYNPIVPYNQNASAFYGLAKAAGDTTQSASSNAVGTYTETAKSKISDMLSAPETITGSTPSITAQAGVRYICGEVSTLNFTPSATGICDVVFTSGSTPAVLTLPTGVDKIKWANGWDETCEANTIYELNVMSGNLGVVAAWS